MGRVFMKGLNKICLCVICFLVAYNISYAQVADLSEMILQPCEIVNEQFKEYVKTKFIPTILNYLGDQLLDNYYFTINVSDIGHETGITGINISCEKIPPERALFLRRSQAKRAKKFSYTLIDGIIFEVYEFSKTHDNIVIKDIEGDNLIVNYVDGERALVPAGGDIYYSALIQLKADIIVDCKIYDSMKGTQPVNKTQSRNKNVAKATLSSCEIINESLKEYLINKYIPVISAPINQIGDYYNYITFDKDDEDIITVKVTSHLDSSSDRKRLVPEYKYKYYTVIDGITFEIYSNIPDCFIKPDNGKYMVVEYSTGKTMAFIDDGYYVVRLTFEGDNLINYEVDDFMGLEKFYYYQW